MSPLRFFRKKKAEVVPSAPSPQSAPSAPSPEVVEPAPEPIEPEPEPEPEPVPARDRSADYAAVTEAFATWQAQLLAGSKDIHLDPSKDDVLDVSGIHPAGAAQFYSGHATSLRSMYREPDSLASARQRIRHLLGRVGKLEETYGSAPISLVYGTLTWTEISRAKPMKSTADHSMIESQLEEIIDVDFDPTEASEPGADDEATIDVPAGGLADGEDAGSEVVAEDSETEAFESEDLDVVRAEEDPASESAEVADGMNEDADLEGGIVEAEAGGEVVDEHDAGVDHDGVKDEPIDVDDVGDDDSSDHETDGGAQVIEVSEAAIKRTVHVASTTASDPMFTLAETADVSSAVLDALRRHGAPSAAVAEVRSLAHHSDTVEEALLRLRELGRVYLPGCVFTPMTVIGLASSPSTVLLEDLQVMEPAVRGSEFVADLVTGVENTDQIVGSPLDRDPATERGAGMLDVAELDAVEAVASGQSIFINAGPGSDPRRVLASIAADNAASGKTVMYVAGRPSVHRAFVGEMERLGLGEAVVDFSDPGSVPLRLRSGLRQKPDGLDGEEISEQNAQLVENRAKVTEFMSVLHSEHAEWKVSPYDLLGKIVELSLDESAPRPRVRLDVETLRVIADEADRVSYASKLDEALRLSASLSTKNPWAGSKIYSDEEARDVLAEVTTLADKTLPRLIEQTQRASAETGLRPALTLEEWGNQLDLLTDIGDSLDIFQSHIYERSASDMVIATASKEWRANHGHTMSSSDRRHLKKEARDMIRPGQDVPDLHAALAKVQSERDQWRAQAEAGSFPELPTGVGDMHEVYTKVSATIASIAPKLHDGENFETMPLTSLSSRLTELARESGDLANLPRRNTLYDELDEAGLTDLLTDLNKRKVEPRRAEAELDAAYLASVFEHMFSSEPALAAHHTNIGELVSATSRGDRRHVSSMPAYITRAIVNRMRSTITRRSEETMEVDGFLAEHGLSGLKEAVASSSEILTAARPVWAMNAVSIAQFIPPMVWADIVILDGIDTVDEAQLIPAILRGETLVVAGHSGRDGAASALARVLPVVDLPSFASRHDALTAHVLAKHGFGRDHDVFPTAPQRTIPSLHVVCGTGVPGPKSGLVEAPEKEVEKVVDTVIDLALTNPDDSIGVIAANEVHAERIRLAIRDVAKNSSALQALTDVNRSEPFTIVDLASATGLVRDHVIFTVGLGKTVHGRLLHSFGMISTEAGLAGLIDAVEAPRKSLTVVSSFDATDIDRRRLVSPGSKLLVDLLEAYGGSSRPDKGSHEQTPTESLLSDIAWRLEDRGYEAKVDYTRYGSRPIPLAAGHKDIPGTWAVAVTIDDSEYVAEPSLRRRDHFWPGMLYEKGWTVVNTFSTAVFFDPNSQVDRIIAAIDSLRDQSRIEKKPVILPSAQSAAQAPAAQPRGPRPKVTPGLPLAAYSDDELDELVAWITADGVERTDEQLVEALRGDLDLHRRGAQIDISLANVVRRR